MRRVLAMARGPACGGRGLAMLGALDGLLLQSGNSDSDKLPGAGRSAAALAPSLERRSSCAGLLGLGIRAARVPQITSAMHAVVRMDHDCNGLDGLGPVTVGPVGMMLVGQIPQYNAQWVWWQCGGGHWC
jgi:hypothetical protein